MRSSWYIWISFALCLMVAMAAVAWVSWTAVQSNYAEVETRRQAALEERVRVALWRADSTIAPLVAQESLRPWFAYRTFLPADQAYSRMFNDRDRGGRLLPSPLLTPTTPHVLVYFQFEPDGRVTSPQVPGSENLKLAVPRYVNGESIHKAQSQLDQVKSFVDRTKLIAMLPECPAQPVQVVAAPPMLPDPMANTAPPVPAESLQNQLFQNLSSQSPLVQTRQQRAAVQGRRQEIQRDRGQNAVEFDVRNSLLDIGSNSIKSNSATMPSTDMSGVAMMPLWIEGRLVLARRVAVAGREYVQGCLLDWPAIKAVLLETIGDLLPQADLTPVVGPQKDESRMLAALPVRLSPGILAWDDDAALSPVIISLAVAWVCMFLAAAAVAGLLAGVMRLSQRRASFVTAVTHELRTPLTTFQMYAEMLAEGMVPEGPEQRRYLATLRAEAVRLTHMVENVLSYARLERGRADGRLEELGLGQLVERMRQRLAGRAEQAGLELVVEGDDAAETAVVRSNASAVEQILFNLVDNACKYAVACEDKRIHLVMRVQGGAAELCLADHGPGLSASIQRRLFRPFSKSAREAAHSAPGVGLGLSLSRRLARDMGGDLKLEKTGDAGACFVLSLRRLVKDEG